VTDLLPDPPSALATDLDGTLIPLPDHRENIEHLQELRRWLSERRFTLLFATGRHIESVQAAIDEYDLPPADYIIGDVGTSIYHRNSAGQLEPLAEYADHLATIASREDREKLQNVMSQLSELRAQEPEKQGRFKLSYYFDYPILDVLKSLLDNRLQEFQLPFSTVLSIDPFNGEGLLDFLPRGVSKAYALAWWTDFTRRAPDRIVYAGDSGNDAAVFATGYRSIVVGNAPEEVKRDAQFAHAQSNWHGRLYLAPGVATSGVWEGVQWFTDAQPSSPQNG
jgi:HAD superfamily hydrolase (TIGR01484 family)